MPAKRKISDFAKYIKVKVLRRNLESIFERVIPINGF